MRNAIAFVILLFVAIAIGLCITAIALMFFPEAAPYWTRPFIAAFGGVCGVLIVRHAADMIS